MNTLGWLRTIDCARIDDAAIGRLIADAMREARVLRLTGSPQRDDALAFWKSAGAHLGEHQPTLYGDWQDVRFEPDVFQFRHSKTGQPLHTDGAYVSEPPHYCVFYCAQPAQIGGATFFVDAETIAALARADDPGLLDALRTVPVNFGKPAETADNPGQRRPILQEVEGRLTIAWNFYQVTPGQSATVQQLRQRFREFLDRVETSDAVVEIDWTAHEAVFFKEDEVLHGRRAFEAERAGDRVIWKTYFKRGGPRAPSSATGRQSAG
jgi:alpha-ketoglutarate-dependent taurine dioxygenase